ncbi:MAG: DNA polymerase II, partial [Thermoanaerobaculia bacterium]|nr:DNA polymerase II [Thermoanaerobaculia bacterium]
MSEAARGFILQPTYRIEAGRPVVHLFGVLESGGSFLVRDTRFAPHFWIRSTDAERALEIGARNQQPSTRTTMDGEALVRVELPRPSDAPPLRDRLRDKGIQPYEA